MSPGPPQSFQYQRRSVDDCSPGRGKMAQDGGTKHGTFHGEMDRCREHQGWTKLCRSMPERDGKDQGDNSPNQAGSYWFARHSWLATCDAISYPPGVFVCRYHFGLSQAFCFVLCWHVVVPNAFIEPAALRANVIRYACAPTATRSYIVDNTFLCLHWFCVVCYLFGDVAFSNYFVPMPIRLVWRVRCTFSFRMMAFSPL